VRGKGALRSEDTAWKWERGLSVVCACGGGVCAAPSRPCRRFHPRSARPLPWAIRGPACACGSRTCATR